MKTDKTIKISEDVVELAKAYKKKYGQPIKWIIEQAVRMFCQRKVK